MLLIVLDDLGIEKLDFYGYTSQPLHPMCAGVPPQTPPPTPELLSISQTGVWFRNAYAHPVCSATRATILTGRYPFRTGMGYLSDEDDYSLPASEWTIARVLKNGFLDGTQYTCGAFGKWHLSGGTQPILPVDRGFDYFAGTAGNVGGAGNHYDWTLLEANKTSTQPPLQIGGPAGPFDEMTYTASEIGRRARDWIATAPEPFFAYVCFHPPHAPFQVPPLTMVSDTTEANITGLNLEPGDSTSDPVLRQRIYDWMIEAVDTEVGRMLDAVEGRLDRTTVLIVGDNGTPPAVIQQPYSPLHAKKTFYEQGVRVPMLAKGFKVSTAGVPHEGAVHVADVWRTITALSGAALPAGVPHDSFNLKSVLLNPGQVTTRPPPFVQLFRPAGPYTPPTVPALGEHWRAMSNGSFKFLRYTGPGGPSEQAYRLTDDPTECNNLWPVTNLPEPDKSIIEGLRNQLDALSGP